MAILSNTEFGILRLTISRAQKRNSINAEMFDTMTEALSRAASDDAVRVVLLQGGEQIFSAGADLEEMRSQPEVLDRAMTNFFAALRAFPKPVVAQVMGPCVGDALSMLLYCDLVYAAAQRHAGDALLLQPPAELLHRRGLVLRIKQALHPSMLQKRPDHLRVKVIGMVVGEQQIVQPLKGRLAPKHGLPAAGGQEAEGIVLSAEQPVQEQSRVLVSDQHAGVGQQGYADGIAIHRFIFPRPRSHPSYPRNT